MKNKIFLIFLFLPLISIAAPAAKKTRIVECQAGAPILIKVPLGDVMVLEFPERPNESLPGKREFDFKFVGKDLAIKSLVPGSSANLFVYLNRKRCAFKLATTTMGSDDIVVVQYPREKTIEAKYVE